MTVNCVSNFSYAAMTSVRFNFKGVSSHAAEAPDQGRSALDAVELMNVGTNFMREHMIQEARIHYVITNGGGRPNVVPPSAQSWYYVRAPYKHQVDALLERLINISRGAALMTDTETGYEIESGCHNTVVNHTLNKVLYDSMQNMPGQAWDEADYRLASDLQKTADPQAISHTLNTFCAAGLAGESLHSGVLPLKEETAFLRGSTDISNVSKSVPTAQVFTCCVPVGMPGHTWQTVVSAGSEIGRKGMMYAAEVIADASLYLLENPAAVREAREEFRKNGI
jgi:aminobenzoyl-glutamate utilization protein B